MLAGGLPPFDHGGGYRTTAHAGAASRQRAGQGEDFWQYRSQTPEDPASSIDWRRSATGDELFIREHELQSARLLGLWVDPSSGFDWKSEGALYAKADCARILLTALAIRFCESGDMTYVLGGLNGTATAGHLTGRIMDDLMVEHARPMPGELRPETSQIILASDFYGPLEDLRSWVEQEAVEGRTGILFQVCDPMEVSFPFSGRVRFRQPGTGLSRIFGRTELMKDAYTERFQARQAELRTLALSVGWTFMTHNTADPLAVTAFEMMTHMSRESASA